MKLLSVTIDGFAPTPCISNQNSVSKVIKDGEVLKYIYIV